MSETGLPPGLAAFNALKAMATSNFSGKLVPTADALLNRAHRDAVDRGFVVVGSRSELVVHPQPPQMLAVVKAIVEFKSLYEQGQPIYTFEGFGDADIVTGARVNGRIVALAETRAYTRAFGRALNSDEENAAGNQAAVAAQGPQAGALPQLPGAPMAPSQPGVYQGFPGGQIAFGKHKGKHITDPSITIADLQWFTSLTMQDRVTPDLAKRNDAMAEIQRRSGGAPAGAMPMAPAPPGYPAAAAPMGAPMAYPGAPAMPTPGYAPVPGAVPPPPMPAGFAPAPLPAAPGVGVFPPGIPAPAAMAPVPMAPQAPAAPVADPNALGRIAQIAASKGHPWQNLVTYVQTNFQVADPAHLNPQQLQQLEQIYTAA